MHNYIETYRHVNPTILVYTANDSVGYNPAATRQTQTPTRSASEGSQEISRLHFALVYSLLGLLAALSATKSRYLASPLAPG